jgi:hypothetical protein
MEAWKFVWQRTGQQPAGAAAAAETAGTGPEGGAKEDPAGAAQVVVVSDTPPPPLELPMAPPREADELVGPVDEPSVSLSQSQGRPPVARRLSDVELLDVVEVVDVAAGSLSARAARRNAQVRRDHHNGSRSLPCPGSQRRAAALMVRSSVVYATACRCCMARAYQGDVRSETRS